MRLKTPTMIKDDTGTPRLVYFIEHKCLSDFRGRFRANCYYEKNQAFTLFFYWQGQLDTFLSTFEAHPDNTGDEVEDYINWRKEMELKDEAFNIEESMTETERPL